GDSLSVLFLHKYHARQVFEIDLVHDTGVRRNNGQIAEAGLSPAEKCVTLLVAQKLEFGVEAEGLGRSELIHLHRVINHKLGRLQGIDQRVIAAQALHRIAHGGKIDYRWNTSEILEQHPDGRKRDLFVGFASTVPGSQRENVIFSHVAAIFRAKQVLQKNSQ